MADRPKPDAARLSEERLAHALISRGLLTREEANACRAGPDEECGAEAMLRRLAASGHLTAAQARRAAQELESLLDQQIPGYQLLEKLGQGSMGTVYKARQLSMDRLVAVKVLNPKRASDPKFMDRLVREAHLAARLSHNNVVQAIDVGSAGPLHYFVMELVEGKTIRQELDTGKVYPEREAVEIVVQVAQALQHAHARGLVHRDVKPANIILTPDGIAKLADLGMAREADDTELARRERNLALGTPYYISPEQVRGREDIDGRADLYALGATLHHMVTGQPPFPHKGVDEQFRAHLTEKPTPPDRLNPQLSSGIGEVIGLLMAKSRKRRYSRAEDLVIDLECLLAGEGPRIARQKLEADTLEALAEGEAEEERSGPPHAWVWIGVLGALFFLSFVANLILLVSRH